MSIHVRTSLCAVELECQGVNNPARRKVVRDLVQEVGATIVTIQETKMEVIDRQVVVETLGDRFTENFVVFPASGTRGGILLAVDEDHYSIVNSEVGVHSVTAQIITASGLLDWSLTAVYGPQDDHDKNPIPE